MKRKLISFDVFKKIEESSVSSAEQELLAAEEVLSRTLGVDDLKLFCFGESDVTYQSDDGTYIHAHYKLNKDQIILEKIEQLVIEEESEKKQARSVLSDMVDALLDNNDAKASQHFEAYLGMPVIRREMAELNESFKVTVSKPSGSSSPLRHKKQPRSLVAKRIRSRVKTLSRLSSSQKSQLSRRRDTASKKLGGTSNPRWRTYARKVKPSTMKEWTVMCENVMDYLDYKEHGPTIRESAIQRDERGNIVAVALPTLQKRNESKILSFNWKTLDHELKILRGKMKKLAEDTNFCKAMVDLKRYNNISDNNALEETLEKIVTHWPNLLYLTQDELAAQIAEALEFANVKNYSDETCVFMAEGILRMAHHAFTDRVRKITSLAGVSVDATNESEDAYKAFQSIVGNFYPQVDEADKAELQVFSDLYRALHEVYRIATDNRDEATRSEIASYMQACEAVMERNAQIDLNLAEEITNFLYSIAEANVPGASQDWDVSNSSHETINGDNPKMAWAAKQTGAVPSNYEGDWGGTAPVSDGKSYHNNLEDEMRDRSWGNESGDDTWPSLKNPYVPKPFGDYTMKGEKGAEKDGESDWSRWQSNDTWPTLKNPYVPAEVMKPQQYKMKSDNLVIDQ